jgi:hypothetical protein
MRAGIDLDFQAKPQRRRIFRIEAVVERHAPFTLFPLRLSEPGIENTTQRRQRWSDRSGLDLNQTTNGSNCFPDGDWTFRQMPFLTEPCA